MRCYQCVKSIGAASFEKRVKCPHSSENVQLGKKVPLLCEIYHLSEFLRELHAMLMPGVKIVLQDNRFVAGNSLAIIGQDEDCNTYQSRTLSYGTEHCALKNFPCEAELRELVSDLSIAATYKTWQYYWALICNAMHSNPPSSLSGLTVRPLTLPDLGCL
jgi:hypothetical protein